MHLIVIQSAVPNRIGSTLYLTFAVSANDSPNYMSKKYTFLLFRGSNVLHSFPTLKLILSKFPLIESIAEHTHILSRRNLSQIRTWITLSTLYRTPTNIQIMTVHQKTLVCRHSIYFDFQILIKPRFSETNYHKKILISQVHTYNNSQNFEL